MKVKKKSNNCLIKDYRAATAMAFRNGIEKRQTRYSSGVLLTQLQIRRRVPIHIVMLKKCRPRVDAYASAFASFTTDSIRNRVMNDFLECGTRVTTTTDVCRTTDNNERFKYEFLLSVQFESRGCKAVYGYIKRRNRKMKSRLLHILRIRNLLRIKCTFSDRYASLLTHFYNTKHESIRDFAWVEDDQDDPSIIVELRRGPDDNTKRLVIVNRRTRVCTT